MAHPVKITLVFMMTAVLCLNGLNCNILDQYHSLLYYSLLPGIANTIRSNIVGYALTEN
jgi:hypothetical protein